MTDEQYVFNQTNRSRKSTAASARKRRTHNGKAGCTLPHETLKKGELNAMNGPVQSVNLNKPIRNWDNFKSLPATMQEAYVWNLRKKYDISMTNFADMFGVNPNTISVYFKKHPNLKLNGSTSNKTPERRAKLEAFRKWAGIMKENDKEEHEMSTIHRTTDTYTGGSTNTTAAVPVAELTPNCDKNYGVDTAVNPKPAVPVAETKKSENPLQTSLKAICTAMLMAIESGENVSVLYERKEGHTTFTVEFS